MAYGDAGLAVIRHHAVGEVYGIFDIAVGQVFSDFLCRHNCAVFLGFRCGCAQMRGYDDVRRVAQQVFGREVCHVARDDAVRNGFFQCRIVHQTAACKVQQACAGLCCRKQLFIKGISCLIVQGNVQRNVIRFCNQLLHGFLMHHVGG